MSRSRRALLACLFVLVLALASAASVAAATTGGGQADGPSGPEGAGETNATIVEVYPNTNHPGNAGEYLVVDFPSATDLARFSLTDGKTTTGLGNDTVSGAVAFSRAPEITREKVSYPVYELPDHFAMAQSGETIRLYNDGRLVSSTSYERAPQGERWLADRGEWRPRGATSFEARDLPAERVTAFSLPDSPEIPIEVLDGANERLYLGGYSLESEPAVEELLAAHERGVEVRVLVDGTPVGGQSEAEADALDRLADAGIEVRVFDGPTTRYRFHHPKYAVADERALVMTENWKPAGTGGQSSRGWGLVVESRPVADELAAVFEADAGWEDTADWDRSLAGTLVEADPADGEFPSGFAPTTADVESVRVVTAPDNAEDETVALLRSAEESILIKQATIAHDHAFLREAIAAAERGVEVRILLDASWYVADENEAVVRYLDDQAESGGLPIEARLIDPDGFEKLHAKGVIVDDRRTMVGSINWNDNSVKNNREVALVVESEPIAAHFDRVFEADWTDERRWAVPAGVGLGVAAAAGTAVLVGSRLIRFER
ncbi:MAG: phospholipase D-like domain-containing protein [Halalkalicoccus sp.]